MKTLQNMLKELKHVLMQLKHLEEISRRRNVISNVLRTPLPSYAIRVSRTQEKRCQADHKINLEAIVRRLTTFELDNYDNYVPATKNIESTFEAKLSLKEKGKKIKESQSESEDELEQSSDSDLKVVEAILARKYSRGKGKYKGKISLIYFSCEEIGHISTRCPNN